MATRLPAVQDELLEGLHEWSPVQEIVRLTFKALHDVVKAQGDAIKNLERSLSQKVSTPEHATALSEKVNVAELSQTFEELSRIIDAKADASDTTAALERKASRSETHASLKTKADVSEVQRCLDQKANVDEVERLFGEMEAKRASSEERMLALIESKAALADTATALEGKASVIDVTNLLDNRHAKMSAELTEALNTKVSKAAVTGALKQKVSRAEVEAALADASRRFAEGLSAKADVESVGAALSGKASRKELDEYIDGRLGEARAQLQHQLEERASRTEVEATTSALERTINAHHAELAKATDAARLACGRVERDLRTHAKDVVEWLDGKASVGEMAARPTKHDVENWLGRRPERAEMAEAHEALATRMQAEARRQLAATRAEIDERHSALRSEINAEIGTLTDALAAKAGRADMAAALEGKAGVEQVTEWLSGKAGTDDLKAQIALRTQETAQALAQKAEVRQLREACEDLEMRLTIAADESRSALIAAMGSKVDKAHLEPVVNQLLSKANLTDALAMIERKADVEAVNRSLGEVNRELTQRPTIAELNRVVGEQSLIMESLCSEHQLGRWIWKSGKTRGEKHTVPWNVQNINTNLDNFGWEQDKSAITCAAPGLYEVTFGFFTKRKPTVQLLVNGEPVLSAVNSASYAVHHSSGRLAAVGPHSAGNVTGVTLRDYLALPPKARVACSYQGDEHGEGFLGLRKL